MPERVCELNNKHTRDSAFLGHGFQSSCQPTTVPCFPSQRHCQCSIWRNSPHCPAGSSPLRTQAGTRAVEGRKHCYLTKGDVPLDSKVNEASGHKKQVRSSQGWTAEREVSFHSLHFTEYITVICNCEGKKHILQNNMCVLSDPFCHRPRVVRG